MPHYKTYPIYTIYIYIYNIYKCKYIYINAVRYFRQQQEIHHKRLANYQIQSAGRVKEWGHLFHFLKRKKSHGVYFFPEGTTLRYPTALTHYLFIAALWPKRLRRIEAWLSCRFASLVTTVAFWIKTTPLTKTLLRTPCSNHYVIATSYKINGKLIERPNWWQEELHTQLRSYFLLLWWLNIWLKRPQGHLSSCCDAFTIVSEVIFHLF